MNFLNTFGQRKGANIGPAKTCMYIEGSKPYGDDPWCGDASVEGCSYCEKHKAICFVEIDNRENRGFIRHAIFASGK